MYRTDIQITNRLWTVTIVPASDTYKPHLVFVILGGVIVFVAGTFLALWVYTNNSRIEKITKMKQQSESEKAQLILENARQATRAEREVRLRVC